MKSVVIWLLAVAVALLLPWLFYDWAHHRHSGFMISMFSQMGMMIILAMSYNMLLGQAGLFSLCHATFFGFGGYAAAHFLNAASGDELPIPTEAIPGLAGFAGLALALVFGYMATKQRATAFAMITLGIGELVGTAALMFHHFFGGEGGITTNRMTDHSLFGLSYGAGLQVYYLVVAWTFIAVAAMYFLTQTPLGRMANATRDNYERAQFVGYNPRFVRFQQFAFSGFFAGIGGGLYAITYEIVTFDAMSGSLSANALLMAYIGGVAVFVGPIIGAVLITLLQTGVSLLSNSWLVYVGVLFISMVIYAPAGLSGIVVAHRPIWRSRQLHRLAVPYAKLLIPGVATVFGFIGIVELMSFLTIGAAQGKTLSIYGTNIDVHAALPWLIAIACLLLGGAWLRIEASRVGKLWDVLITDSPGERVRP